eukprot:TRINITY_DN11116_c0_g1_i1.p1 TRINITY_DN11116_c0_g1~~TRINITY_DN11116_c0_g1_i1.p1  ORF type:complete len:1162 (+),score=321.36 TRINITY_DN11116_c0_g1_i1:51-3488(+)
MVKTRFSSLDVRAMVNSIRPSAVGCKLTNIYDINSKVYLLKLQRKGFKCLLLMESGMRFHLTEYQRDKSSIPSNYTMKLRKHLRNRRLTSISQLGADRIVDFQFGHGENAFHLLLEIYVSGNLILTDHEYNILTLLRVHNDQETKVAMRQVYPLGKAMGLLKVPIEEFGAEIEALLDLAAERAENQEIQEIEQDDEKASKEKKKGGESAFAKRSRKRVSHSAMPVFQLLHKLAPFADPVLCASCIAKASEAAGRPLQNAFKLTVDDLSPDEVIELVSQAAEDILDTLRSVSRPDDLGGGSMPKLVQAGEGAEAEDAEEDDDDEDEAPDGVDAGGSGANSAPAAPKGGPPPEAEAPVVPGWIVRKKVHVPPADPTWANEDFTPLLPPAPEEAEAIVSFPSFHRCVDEFFTKLEENKAVEQKAQHAQSVMARVERIRADQGRRLEQLEAEQESSERKARLIERNVELVDRALAMLNTMIASQVDWGELWREVKRQQRLGHPIAEHIHSLNLEQNEFKLLLADVDEDEEDGEDDGTTDRPMEVVPLDLSLSSHANVAKLHTRRKETRDKTSRTACHAEAAIKSAERKAQQDLQKFELKQTIRRVRNNWWFEKFIWFISSENYLVVAGHDHIQTEQLFLKHMGMKDAFIQADVAGARTCFVRNPEGGEVPPATLREAGTLSLCHSSAWDKQIVISAWSVPVSQVTRGKPPEGDYHLVDGFHVVGQRHFMPPLHLEMGMTLLFQVSAESCEARHKGERRSRYLEAMAGQPAHSEEAQEEALRDDETETGNAENGRKDTDGARKDEEQELDGEITEDGVDGRKQDDEEQEEDDDEDKKPDDTEENATKESEEASANGKTRTSKAERRRMKKDGGEEEPFAEVRFDPPDRSSPSGKENGKTAANKGSSGPLPRGQRSKAKKVKAKYADQDEEERELRMALLGSRVTKRAAEGARVSIDEVTDPERSGETGGTGSAAGTAEAGTGATAANASQASGKGDSATSDTVERRPPPPRRQPPGARDSEVLRAGCEADGGSVDALPVPQLDLLTGQPQAEDDVQFAMAMVAPYCSLGGHYTLRVKLTPGNQKKGQAVRQCLKIFEEQLERRAWKQLAQAVPESEATQMMCGSCKLSMPGLQKLQQQLRKQKQQKAQKK